MQRLLRATDTIWRTSAFDPRRPVDPDWASRAPAPILRSGDEEHIFEDSPWEHHQGGDAMAWRPQGPRDEDYEDPESEWYDPYTDPRYEEGGDIPVGPHVPDHDLRAIGRHREYLRGHGGQLAGSDPSVMAQYHDDSNVNHYYTYNPRGDSGKPWLLNTTHWSLQEPMTSRHVSFENAAARAAGNKEYLKTLGIG